MSILHLSPKRNARFKDITGERFGKWIAISYKGNRKTKGGHNTSVWLCRCDCGTEKDILASSLHAGKTNSCGCALLSANGDSARNKIMPEYHAWCSMRKRCFDKKNRGWPNYGGRGITVCDRWRDDYRTFFADMGRRPSPKHSLDRIDNDGNYEPDNCRWATRKQQINNRRPVQRRNWREAAKHAYGIVRDFEMVLCSYTGAKYAVAVESCTAAILLACAYLKVKEVSIPKFTYCSVPMSVIHAGGTVKFRDEQWLGSYQLVPYPIYDCARHFTSGMYKPGTFQCLSFHWNKHLPIGRGGAILFDDSKAVEWLKRARFDGRKEGVAPKNDKGLIRGWHFYMPPPVAAQGMMLMARMAEHNEPLPNDDYPDLSLQECFR